MNQTRRLALTDLMDTAARLKANAVIGVDIDGGPLPLPVPHRTGPEGLLPSRWGPAQP